MVNDIKIEICIGSADDGLKAASYPIDRIELNSALELGGLTPTLETLKYLKERIDVPLCCMDRIRSGDFCYSETEYEVMFRDAKNMLEAGADGIVFGFLNEDRTVNKEKTKKMAELIHSYGKEAIFHKAFDEIADLDEAIQTLISFKIDRILTSGKAVYPEILKGCEEIRRLNDRYGDSIQLLPGGGVRIENIQDVLRISNSKQVHMTSKMTSAKGYPVLDEDQLEKMLEKISSM